MCVHRRGRDDATGGRDGGHDSDVSPPRRRQVADNSDDGDSDVSPPRRRPHHHQQQQQQGEGHWQQSSDDANGRRRQELREDKLQTRTTTGVTAVDSRSTERTTDHSSRERSNSNNMRTMASG